ncbi:MAG: GIY-YIG nuclease family protein, partial [Selenomonadaceae bacterium]|nr:GIY-YIG nuclease family protein [Selenomonadaceae bacterium]
MTNQIMTHDRFGSVRTVELEGEKYFVGRDVSKILGYANAEGFVARHVQAADKKRIPVRSLNANNAPPTIIINSHGLTDLCNAASSAVANDILSWLLSEQTPVEEKEKKSAQVPQLLDLPEFGQMRWLIIDGDFWFVAADLCRILDLGNVSQAVSRFDTNELTSFKMMSGGQMREMIIVNEPGLYRLIFASRKPEAKAFQDKVYHEVLPSIRKNGYYISEQAAQSSLFPDEEPIKEKKAIRRPLAEVAVVYVILLSNGLVKIGYTSDFNRRLKEIRKETKLDIIDFFTTNFMSLDEARKLESTIKAKFFDCVVSGEFFNAPFETVKAALNDNSKVEKLLAIADRMDSSPEKNTLLIQAAAL